MAEGQLACVQSLSSHARDLRAAIYDIPNEGVPQRSHMHTYLVGTPRMQDAAHKTTVVRIR
jgi:hypothetical protein